MDGVVEGRIVHFVLNEGPHKGEHRPAIIVRVWSPTTVNLQVITDADAEGKYNDVLPPVMWKTSILFDESASMGTWHWIEKA